MTHRREEDRSVDPLDRLAEDLQGLRPRAVGASTRRRVAARLEPPPAAPSRRARGSLRLAVAAAAAALAAASGAVAWSLSRPELATDHRPAAATEPVSAQAGAGCECRVRFQPRPPVRAADARRFGLDRRA